MIRETKLYNDITFLYFKLEKPVLYTFLNMFFFCQETCFVSDCATFVKNRCYAAYSGIKTWSQARDICISEGGFLADVCNQQSNDILMEIMRDQGKGNVYNT